ncbi:MAG: glycogen/starch/alpha-glucan phosphorylase, partial [Lactobacillus sp.]|nr:glycogen/starch/alpha-glucan phosphorylase [Lactobacillus sp.]
MAKYLAEHERKMQLTKEEFKNRLKRKLNDYYEEDIDTASTSELFAAISAIVRDGYAPQWRRTRI